MGKFGPLIDKGAGLASDEESLKPSGAVSGLIASRNTESRVGARQTKSLSHRSQSALLGLLLSFHVFESEPHVFLPPQRNPHG